jgi:hypothetical protein
MTLGKMLDIVIKGDQQFEREYAEYLAQNRLPKRARR